jgi:hypothetical protein
VDSIQEVRQWLNEKMEAISKKMPDLVHSEPASFACGFNIGYKQCVLDLTRYLDSSAKQKDI